MIRLLPSRLLLRAASALALAVLLATAHAQVQLPPAAKGDENLRAMVDELNRSRELRIMFF